jgi:hypothetical protein
MAPSPATGSAALCYTYYAPGFAFYSLRFEFLLQLCRPELQHLINLAGSKPKMY